MTDPIQALAEAARELLKDKYPADHGCFHVCNYVVDDLQEALAAYDAAQVPTDAEIEAWRKDIDYARIHASRNRAVGEPGSERLADEFRLSQIIEDGVRLMRRARPDAGLLRAAKRIVEADWATLFSTKKCDAAWRGLVPIKAADLIDDLRAEVARVEGK